MARVEKVLDVMEAVSPLRITRSKARKVGQKGRKMPRIRVKCGCCKQAVEIYHDEELTGSSMMDTLEINGVYGTVGQWRQVLLPLLGLIPD